MRRLEAVAVVAVLWVTAGLGVLLLARERGGPPHRDVTLAGGVPATFYLPPDIADPPAIVMGHGYSGDRATMSALARSLAQAGYAVLAIDFGGHGANDGSFVTHDRSDDLAAGLDWLEESEEVDAERLALLGHSMGSYAALELAKDEGFRVAATVVLGSGYRGGIAATSPRNVLLLVGERESASVTDASRELADAIWRAGGSSRVAEVEGAGHLAVLWSDQTVAETVAWLDRVFEVERDGPAAIDDARLGVAAAYVLCMTLAFAALGWGVGRLVPRSPKGPAAGFGPFVEVAVALALAAPVSVVSDVNPYFSGGFGEVISLLGVAGWILLVIRLRRMSSRAPNTAMVRGAAATGAALAGGFVLVAPLGGLVHRLLPTPERLPVAALALGFLLPFFLLLQGSLRRGTPRRATLASVAGHGLVLAAVGGGVVAGLYPGIVLLAVPLLAGVFVLAEVFGAAVYAVSRNGALVGAVEATWVAGIVGVMMPLT